MKGHKPLRMGTISDLSHIIVGWGKDRGTLSVRGDGGGGGTAAGGFPGIATWACLALTLHHYTRSSHQYIPLYCLCVGTGERLRPGFHAGIYMII